MQSCVEGTYKTSRQKHLSRLITIIIYYNTSRIWCISDWQLHACGCSVIHLQTVLHLAHTAKHAIRKSTFLIIHNNLGTCIETSLKFVFELVWQLFSRKLKKTSYSMCYTLYSLSAIHWRNWHMHVSLAYGNNLCSWSLSQELTRHTWHTLSLMHVCQNFNWILAKQPQNLWTTLMLMYGESGIPSKMFITHPSWFPRSGFQFYWGVGKVKCMRYKFQVLSYLSVFLRILSDFQGIALHLL